VGSTDVTWAADGCGFPRIKFESAHTALRRGPIWPINAVACAQETRVVMGDQ
jgi:hypothetical protein